MQGESQTGRIALDWCCVDRNLASVWTHFLPAQPVPLQIKLLIEKGSCESLGLCLPLTRELWGLCWNHPSTWEAKEYESLEQEKCKKLVLLNPFLRVCFNGGPLMSLGVSSCLFAMLPLLFWMGWYRGQGERIVAAGHLIFTFWVAVGPSGRRQLSGQSGNGGAHLINALLKKKKKKPSCQSYKATSFLGPECP